MPRIWRFGLFLFAAIAIFFAAVNNEVYSVASPPALAWHVALRKVESVAGFTVVALTAAWWLAPRRNLAAWIIIGMAAYSGLIEITQDRLGSTEGLWSNAFDVACGGLGGAIGWFLFMLRSRV